MKNSKYHNNKYCSGQNANPFIDDFGVNSHLIKREAILVGVPRSSV